MNGKMIPMMMTSLIEPFCKRNSGWQKLKQKRSFQMKIFKENWTRSLKKSKTLTKKLQNITKKLRNSKQIKIN
uniref:Uncharacterized protein n=1 Tax=Megaselia scalaris TaxID=36166 RepID=T1GZL7_MEGSC